MTFASLPKRLFRLVSHEKPSAFDYRGPTLACSSVIVRLSLWAGTGLCCLAAVAAQAQGPTKVEVPFGASDVLDEGAPVVVPEPLASEVDAQYRAAKAAGNRRDFEEARERFTEVLRLKPDHLEADLSLGVVLMVLGESEAGRARLERIAALSDPIANRAFLLLANQAAMEERPEDAIRYYAEAVERFPEWFAVRYNLANSLADQERFEEAAPIFESALMLRPRAKFAWTGLGQSFVELGRPLDAEACFRRTIALDSNIIYARMYLARVLSERGEKEAANTLYEEAVRSAVKVGDKEAVLRIRLEQNSL